MAVSEELKNLVDQMPDADDRGMFTTNIDKEKIERAIAAIHAGGRENVLGLIEMLGEPGSEEDVKPHYALHCLANHVLVVKDDAGRKALCEAMASQLDSDRPKHVQAYLCQELGWAGRAESVSALGKVLTDQELCAPASMALVAIRDGAAAELRKAWPQATGATRRHIMDALADLADEESVAVFTEAMGDDDREVRIAAAAGLASLGRADAADALLAAADAADGWERIKATKNCLVLAEKLAAGGMAGDAKRIYERLQQSRTDDTEQHIREAARRGLSALAAS
jgi:HEAT repeat protein